MLYEVPFKLIAAIMKDKIVFLQKKKFHCFENNVVIVVSYWVLLSVMTTSYTCCIRLKYRKTKIAQT